MNTSKRPLELMSPSTELKAALGVEVIWTVNGSGVGLEVWAETATSEPPKSAGTMQAHKNQKTCFTNSSAIKTQIPSRLDALGELSSLAQAIKNGHFKQNPKGSQAETYFDNVLFVHLCG